MRKGLLIIWLLSLGISSAAQLYQTSAGTIMASGRYKGADVTAVSNRLFMHLNYDKVEMHLRLLIPSITTSNDSLNELLQKLTGQVLIFTGKMDINFLQTKSHAKQKVSTDGMLLLNGVSKPFRFNSLLVHFPSGNISCVLSGVMVINLNEFKITNILPGEEKITVTFNQLVLKRPGE